MVEDVFEEMEWIAAAVAAVAFAARRGARRSKKRDVMTVFEKDDVCVGH